MDLQERYRWINWLLVDVDGVLTDGRIIYTDAGAEIKAFHVRDGSGLKLWSKVGKKSGILTGRSSEIVKRRAAELDMAAVVQGASDKLVGWRRILTEHKVQAEEVCYIGDDLPDVPVLRRCGLAVTVADACDEALAEAHYVTRRRGGEGAVRETIELILRAQGVWQGLVAQFRND